MYLYLKAIHIIFVVTWFAGLFYFPRLLIYNEEAGEKPVEVRDALRAQFAIMMKRLWYGITWPSAILTLIFGLWVLINGNWIDVMGGGATWLWIKLGFVLVLYLYHLSLQRILSQQLRNQFRYSSIQLRIWNEVATVILVAVVMLVVVKSNMSLVWGLGVLAALIVLLMSAIRLYKAVREKRNQPGN